MPFNPDEYESGRWMKLGDTWYFLKNNDVHSWYIQPGREGVGFTVWLDNNLAKFPTLKEAKEYVETTYELSS